MLQASSNASKVILLNYRRLNVGQYESVGATVFERLPILSWVLFPASPSSHNEQLRKITPYLPPNRGRTTLQNKIRKFSIRKIALQEKRTYHFLISPGKGTFSDSSPFQTSSLTQEGKRLRNTCEGRSITKPDIQSRCYINPSHFPHIVSMTEDSSIPMTDDNQKSCKLQGRLGGSGG